VTGAARVIGASTDLPTVRPANQIAGINPKGLGEIRGILLIRTGNSAPGPMLTLSMRSRERWRNAEKIDNRHIVIVVGFAVA
jgi:hypothetical protein